MKKPELLAPAGSMASLYAAIEAGCDAVYLSGYMFGARQFATNFSEDEIIEAIKICHLYGIKVYVTVNTLIYEDEVETFLNYIDFLHKNSVDAILIQDIGMLDLVKQTFPNLEVHASTQMHIHNENGVKFCEKMGIKRCVLARETSIDLLEDIRKSTDLELEVFVHGALCISYSGQCLMSSIIGGRSGNRGACAGSCRLPYKIVDDNNKKYNNGNYPLSTKDLNTLENIGKLIEIGVDSLKIEGRMKRPEYVYLVVSLYRKAIDSYLQTGKVVINKNDIEELKKVFNRDFTKGFIFNERYENFINEYHPNHIGIEIGKVIDYKNKFAIVKLSKSIANGDGIRIAEKDVGLTITSLFKNKQKVAEGYPNDIISIKIDGNIKKGDTILLTTDKSQLEDINKTINKKSRKVLIKGILKAKVGEKLYLSITDGVNNIEVYGDFVEESKKVKLDESNIQNHIDRLGNTIYKFEELEILKDENVFINIKSLNDIRRIAIEKLNSARLYKLPYLKKEYNRTLPNYNISKNKSCLITNEELYNIVKNDGYNNIYVEDKALYEKLKKDEKIILKLPRVEEKKQYEKMDVMIGELGGILFPNKKVSDVYLNVVNSYSIALLHSLGIDKVTLSYELTFEQIKKIIEAYRKHYNKNPNVEVITFSQIEVMVSKFNINNYYKTNNKLYLKDRFNNKYPIINKGSTSCILNYKLNIINNENDYYDIGVNNIRHEFLSIEQYKRKD